MPDAPRLTAPSHSASRLMRVRLPADVAGLPRQPGSYVLILRSRRRAVVQVGRWGQLELAAGWYLYVGSALGPGGLRARVARHARATKRVHWHIDHVTPWAEPSAAWYCVNRRRLEHRWAGAVSGLPGIQEVPGFGCSDCSCAAHLFYSPNTPDFGAFRVQADLLA